MKQNIIIIGLLLSVLVLSGCTDTNEEPTVIHAEEKEISGTIFTVKLVETFTMVVFERGFHLIFYSPNDELLESYPFLDTFTEAYTTLVLLEGVDVTINYVFYDGVNYFDYCRVNV